jgi:hypothetical protein
MLTAFAVAYLLVLQSVLGAFASAAGPRAVQLDAFGNVICTHEGVSEQPGDPLQKHMPTCCVLGCNLAASPLAGPPDAAALPAVFVFESVSFAVATVDHLAFERSRSPLNPRAPPASA